MSNESDKRRQADVYELLDVFSMKKARENLLIVCCALCKLTRFDNFSFLLFNTYFNNCQ